MGGPYATDHFVPWPELIFVLLSVQNGKRVYFTRNDIPHLV